MIGLLRSDEPFAVEPPQPTLAQIPALVEESRSAGLAVSFRSEVAAAVPEAGRPHGLPRGPGRA